MKTIAKCKFDYENIYLIDELEELYVLNTYSLEFKKVNEKNAIEELIDDMIACEEFTIKPNMYKSIIDYLFDDYEQHKETIEMLMNYKPNFF